MDALTYVMPIKAARAPSAELTRYLREIGERYPVIVVDGSDHDVFAAAHHRWSPLVRHVPPDPDLLCANGKVRGVLTALELAATDLVVIADDDVRYSARELERVVEELATLDLVVPQNYFEPLPWHARWDTARTLINRMTGGDFPGTLGLRKSVLRGARYDGDVLFENLELIRTVSARGGRWKRLPDLYVRRLPPTARHFFGQRVRQAYDEFARPARLALWLAVLPALAVAIARRRHAMLLIGAVATVAAAELGRRRADGRRHFHWTCSMLAPVWVLERAVTVWLAVVVRCRGGVRYAGRRIVRAANSTAALRRHQPGPAS